MTLKDVRIIKEIGYTLLISKFFGIMRYHSYLALTSTFLQRLFKKNWFFKCIETSFWNVKKNVDIHSKYKQGSRRDVKNPIWSNVCMIFVSARSSYVAV